MNKEGRQVYGSQNGRRDCSSMTFSVSTYSNHLSTGGMGPTTPDHSNSAGGKYSHRSASPYIVRGRAKPESDEGIGIGRGS